jgi:N-acyl-phosphatidylethanolamine-hydrolysing phospholipase D
VRHLSRQRGRLLAGGVLGVCLAATAQARPPHHTDDGFRNLEPTPQGGPTVTLPFFARRVWSSLWGREGALASVPNDGSVLRAWAGNPHATATWIGHSTVLVQMDRVTFLTDPIWSQRASPLSFAGPARYAPPAVAMGSLPPIDFVVVSHSHYDHLDLDTLRLLSNGRTRFFVPLRQGALLRAHGIEPVEELDWWESREIGGVTVHCVPAKHWSQRGLFDRNRALWSGWAVVGPTRRFYFAGDTGYFGAVTEIGSRLGPFGLAAIPIGAYDPPAMMQSVHLNPEEALQVGLDVRGERLLGVHYGTFDLTDEPFAEPPRRFREAGAARALPSERLWLPPLGETRVW